MVGQEQFNILQNQRAAGKLLAKFVVDLKAALKAGNPLTEAVQIAGAAITDLAPVLTQLPAIQAEATENFDAEVMTLAATGLELKKALFS